MEQIQNVILVLSGKGGVGKSTVTTSLALSLVALGYSVGVLDIDLTGPSLPLMFGLQNQKIHQSAKGWIPCYTDSSKKLGVVSLGFLLANNYDAVIWRGPKKNAMISQFVNDIAWGQLDFLLVDTPPGTSDEHISIAGQLKNNITGAILVTTPQSISLIDVRRELSFCNKVGISILGLIENMSGFVCEHCHECTNVFSKGGGLKFAASNNIPFLGMLPIDPKLSYTIESGTYCNEFHNSLLFEEYKRMVQLLLNSESISKIIK